jgi:hypothetical protein
MMTRLTPGHACHHQAQMWRQRRKMDERPCTKLHLMATWTSPGCCWTVVWAGTGVSYPNLAIIARVMCTHHHDPADTITHAMTGANVDAKFTHGSTPLHTAAFEGHVDVARLLLDRGMG